MFCHLYSELKFHFIIVGLLSFLSISHSISAGSGMVFVGSGYGQFRQVPGNVLLAFKPSE